MATGDDRLLARAVAEAATPLSGDSSDLDGLLEAAGNARIVLLGEASHGTHDFYRVRAELTKRLILERGFSAVAVEADWPDAFRVNRHVHLRGTDEEAVDALGDFRRFPAWMWRNADVLDFVGWLRARNEERHEEHRVGLYGLDLYSLHASMSAVVAFLRQRAPETARRARELYACFDRFGSEPEEYARATAYGLTPGCEDEVIEVLAELQRRQLEAPARERLADQEERFAAEQNARVALSAEAYYRTMLVGAVSSWNLRDTHMADTLDALLMHLHRGTAAPKVVVWAHNSHVGDARATQLGAAGELNLGQLARERHPDQVFIVGFSTYEGTVTAAEGWGEPAGRMRVRPALRGSYEELFHQTGLPAFALPLQELGEAAGGLREERLQRAIGVVYRPGTERVSHYLHARLPAQLDAVIHLDHTRAVEPLERTAGWERGEEPETFPTGI